MYIPINRSLKDILIGLRRSGGLVLPDFNYHHSYRLMRRLAKTSGVKGIRFHDLRHSFASNFMMAGGSIYDLQKILGHATITMTERYSHLSPEHLVGKTEILDFGTSRRASVTQISACR